MRFLIWASQQICEITIIISALQVRKLSLRCVQWDPQDQKTDYIAELELNGQVQV